MDHQQLLQVLESAVKTKDWEYIKQLQETFEVLGDKESLVKVQSILAKVEEEHTLKELTFATRAKSLLNEKDYEGAIADYTKAIELNPNDAVYYNNRGDARKELRDYSGAIADYTKAIELNPNDAVYYNNRGNARLYKKDDDDDVYDDLDNYKDRLDAIIDYTKAIELEPDNARYYKNRGDARQWGASKLGGLADYIKAENIYLQEGNIEMYKFMVNKLSRINL